MPAPGVYPRDFRNLCLKWTQPLPAAHGYILATSGGASTAARIALSYLIRIARCESPEFEIGRLRNLADVTIEFDASADFVCLVGENGAGKSNLLEPIAFAVPHSASAT